MREYQGNINVQDQNGLTPLITACEQGDHKLVKQVIKKGAYVDLQAEDGWTPLLMACREGHTDITKTLIKNYASVNLSDKTGRTPLMTASAAGNKKIIELLLENGARIDETDLEGKTALHQACFEGRRECAQTLLNHKANPSIADKHCETPYDVARRMRRIAISKLLEFVNPPTTDVVVEHRSSISSTISVQHRSGPMSTNVYVRGNSFGSSLRVSQRSSGQWSVTLSSNPPQTPGPEFPKGLAGSLYPST